MENNAKILVVDDEIDICMNVEKILVKNNYEVVKANSAKEALEKMAKESFSLLISDVVMPEMNGLEFLKSAKKQWPLTKAVMMTAYASTDTAVNAIRLGALDYLPKPFTPDELRTTVNKALSGELIEISIKKEDLEAIEIIDVDMPFDRSEVAKYTESDYADRLTRTDIPAVSIEQPETLENFCALGDMTCDIYKKLGTTCKGGIKKNECPQKKAKKKKSNASKQFDAKKLIGIDQPFDYEEVVAATSAEYVKYMDRDGFAFLPYEELKKLPIPPIQKNPEQEAEVYDVQFREILAIDDEVAVNNNIRKILTKKGHHVEQAFTKDEAIEKINRHFYKLILLDLRIPGVKELELLKAIVENQPDARVIIITGYASIETAVETARIGAVDYLSKPFTPDEIRNVTDKALRMAA